VAKILSEDFTFYVHELQMRPVFSLQSVVNGDVIMQQLQVCMICLDLKSIYVVVLRGVQVKKTNMWPSRTLKLELLKEVSS